MTSVAGAQPMDFGIDVAGATAATSSGLTLTYGSLWAGAWNQKYGWAGIQTQLETAKANGLTPVVQWWYWGDDISPSCVEQGCSDRYQGVFKDKATWYRLSNELADLINTVMGPNSGTVVIVENEFNKNGIETYEAFDGYLVEHAAIFHARNQRVVIGLGNWGQANWSRFDRAAAVADFMGTQILYSSVRQSNAVYLGGADALVSGAQTLQSLFGKPVFVTDFAFSSYPEPSYATYQDMVVRDVFAKLPALKNAGVRAMVWRMFRDDPTFNTANYHGMAERFWGLVHADGSPKQAFYSFQNGIVVDRGTVSPPPALPPPAPTGLTATGTSTQVALTWNAADGATGYNVKAATTSGGPYTVIGAQLPSRNFTHSGLINGTTYYYVVSAVGANGEGANSAQVSAVPVAAPAPAPTASGISVWSPTDQASITGSQTFKALLAGYGLNSYQMYWKVDGGAENLMGNSEVGGPHKEATVNVATWTWRGQGPYTVTFVARASKKTIIAQQSVTIYVR